MRRLTLGLFASPLFMITTLATLLAGTDRVAAYLTTGGTTITKVNVGTLAAPTITTATPGADTVELAWSTVIAPSGAVVYYVTRDGGPAAGNCPTSKTPAAVTSCTDSVTTGTHTYTVAAVWRSWTSTSSSAEANVAFGPISRFLVAAPGVAPSAGTAFEETITAQDEQGNIVTSYTGEKPIVFSGPENSPTGKSPVYPGSVTFSKGVGKASITLFKASQGTMLTAKEGSVSGTSASFAVNSAGVTLSYNTTCPVSVAKNSTTTFTINVPNDAYGNPFTNGTSIGVGLSLTNSANWGFGSVGTASATVNITTGPAKNIFTVVESGREKTTTLTATAPSGFTAPPSCVIKSGS